MPWIRSIEFFLVVCSHPLQKERLNKYISFRSRFLTVDSSWSCCHPILKLYIVQFSQREMGCAGCFSFLRKFHRSVLSLNETSDQSSQDFLLPHSMEDAYSYNGGSDCSSWRRGRSSEEILLARARKGLICREVPVNETRKVTISEDENGNKMINEYVRERKIGSGSYGKVVLYQSVKDGKHYAVKVFHKSHLLKLRVAPSETAMTDVLREVSIMKMLDHPNIVKLIEVIDDPLIDNFYMVLEYVAGKRMCDFDSCPRDGIGESESRRYLRDVVSGLMYLHAHNIIHGDIKPDNLLVTSTGNVKIADFSVSQVFEDNNDELRRSPGTPVFTAPECCLGSSYHGRAADTWALGVTLYCMVLGQYPFLGETLQDTYDKIVNNSLTLPDDINPQLKSLLEGLLHKDHPWVIGEEGPIPEFLCHCRQKKSSCSPCSSRTCFECCC
ncbi:serine/threonine-protein kinase GRIK1-like isoform X2 [Asparagus officinalis]|uniref:serine/threonine-protein kinase GRIK1-like isoform X2 n=1 Tax=Asparagus officinalis TaxID=4686 RepID=UPI00098E1BCF|nr:serine/threonine-protein kinase GRIK1-like isoform X2 [Asparagus officinalis]